MHKNLGRILGKRKMSTISVDIDGTIADISARIATAEQTAKPGTALYWDTLLDGELYHLDRPIEEARKFLVRWTLEAKGEIVYLSGRRKGTQLSTRRWLEKHAFPTGRIIHRVKGSDSRYFKTCQLRELAVVANLEAHFGDRLEDDGGAAKAAGVRFCHIHENDGSSWPTLEKFLNPSS
jgi:FMN phosphatase YigB (HAD superfamily)